MWPFKEPVAPTYTTEQQGWLAESVDDTLVEAVSTLSDILCTMIAKDPDAWTVEDEAAVRLLARKWGFIKKYRKGVV